MRVPATTRTSWPSASAESATAKASAQVSTITRLGGRLARNMARSRVRFRASRMIVVSDDRMHTWDSLPPRSIARCSTVGLQKFCASGRVDECHNSVVTEGAGHFIKSWEIHSSRAASGDGVARGSRKLDGVRAARAATGALVRRRSRPALAAGRAAAGRSRRRARGSPRRSRGRAASLRPSAGC